MGKLKLRKSFIFLGTMLTILGGALFLKPYVKTSLRKKYQSSTAIYARDGELLRLTLSNDHKYRQWVPLDQISISIQQSFIEIEDRHFYSHPGINPASIARAIWSTYLSSGRRRGASTITMQLARLMSGFDSSEVTGKIRQIFLAFQLEYLYSKQEILEAYLNLVPMGGNIEGVSAASLIFFKKRPSEVDWSEALSLAVIPQNPNKRTLLKGYNKHLKKARRRVFTKISRFVPPEQQGLMNLELTPSGPKSLPFLAPHFVQTILGRNPGLSEVKTTLDISLQRKLEKRVSDYIKASGQKGLRNAAVLLMNWQTSEVITWIGSADFFDASIEGQNDGVRALRSPGSSLKPFIYGMALEQGLIHPGTILKDTSRAFGTYDPENFDNEFRGPISASEALNQSRNLPAVELMTKLHEPDFYDFLIKAQVGAPKNREYYGYSIALGGYELSLLELVELYGILPNRGWYAKARLSEQEIRKSLSKKQLLSYEASYLVLDMLSKAELQSRRFRKLDRPNSISVSWKTGTSSGFRDAWTVGVFGNYVMGVWLGNFSGESNQNFIGRSLAAPLFFDLIDTIRLERGLDQQALLSWLPPSSVKNVSICPVSGKIPGPHCHHQSQVYFIPGTSPIDKCDVHRQIWISKKDGKLSCSPNPETDMAVVHEYWSTDLLDVFAHAGLPRKPAPENGMNCLIRTQIAEGMAPEIISPRSGAVYSLRSHKKSTEIIPFLANLDSSAKELYWFLNNEFVGKTKVGKPYHWQAKAGIYDLRAVDNLGRSSSRSLEVKFVD